MLFTVTPVGRCDGKVIFCDDECRFCNFGKYSHISGKPFPEGGIQRTICKRMPGAVSTHNGCEIRTDTGFDGGCDPPAAGNVVCQQGIPDLYKHFCTFYKEFCGRISDTAPSAARTGQSKTGETVIPVLFQNFFCYMRGCGPVQIQ